MMKRCFVGIALLVGGIFVSLQLSAGEEKKLLVCVPSQKNLSIHVPHSDGCWSPEYAPEQERKKMKLGDNADVMRSVRCDSKKEMRLLEQRKDDFDDAVVHQSMIQGIELLNIEHSSDEKNNREHVLGESSNSNYVSPVVSDVDCFSYASLLAQASPQAHVDDDYNYSPTTSESSDSASDASVHNHVKVRHQRLIISLLLHDEDL